MEVDSVGDSEGGGGETRFLVHGKAVISWGFNTVSQLIYYQLSATGVYCKRTQFLEI